MTENKRTVNTYMQGFRNTNRSSILSCLTDDVERLIPGLFDVTGKEEFGKQIVDEGFVGRPEIQVTRLTEENDVVVVEGAVRTARTDGTLVRLVFCDVFEM